ncbi:hypothetical protein [Pseudonocardia spinosispora]|uniref:hypothetical protein n=1 Tax=Pseudonocardia spinosispora TaxID=103441 RepID=UPI003CCBADFE
MDPGGQSLDRRHRPFCADRVRRCVEGLGLALARIDVIGGQLIEINVTSPTRDTRDRGIVRRGVGETDRRPGCGVEAAGVLEERVTPDLSAEHGHARHRCWVSGDSAR